MDLRIDGVRWSVDGTAILRGVDLDVHSGEFVGLIGPNGSGKSSLLRCIYRALRPDAGLIALDGADVWEELRPRDVARRAAVVLQEFPSEFDFTVHDIVMMGRSPHKGLFDRDDAEDFRLAAEALDKVGLSDFAQRNFQTLSGGEKQRVLVARALAQQARVLILDEPTNHLDIFYQLEILDLVKGLGVTTLAALHDLNLAALYCDRIYVLKDGAVVASGALGDVLCAELIRDVYHVTAEVRPHPATGRPHITFIPGNGRSSGRV